MINNVACLLSLYRIWHRVAFHHNGPNYNARNTERTKPKFLLILITLSLVGLFNSVYSQHQHKLDSLERLVRTSNGIDKYDPLIELAIEYVNEEDNKKAIQIAKEAHAIAYHYRDSLKIIHSGRLMGQIFNRMNKISEAKNILLKVLPIAIRTPAAKKDLIIILNNLAMVYTDQGNYAVALNYNFQSLELREKLGDKGLISNSLNNIGWIYYKLNSYDKAISYFKSAIELKKKVNNPLDLDRSLINLSLCYVGKNEYDTATNFLNESLSTCKGNCSSQIKIESELTKGMIALGEHRFKDAQASAVRSYNLSCKTDNQRFQLENLILIAKIYLKQNIVDSAKAYLLKSEILDKQLTFNSLKIDMYELFSSLYNKISDFKKVAIYQNKYIQLRDSLYGEELTQNLMVVQAEYEQHENKAKIESQNKVLALKEEIITRQNILTIVAGVAIMLLTSLIFVLYRNNRQKKTINEILEQKVQERTRELEVSYALIQKAFLDQNNFIEKAAKDIRNPLSTMKGLCSLGLKEVSESEAQQYLVQLNDTINQLDIQVNGLTSKSEL